MKTCIIHIGHPKSGTSFIQTKLHIASINSLLEEIFYPLDFSKYGLHNLQKRKPWTFPGNGFPLIVSAKKSNLDQLHKITKDIFKHTKQIALLSAEDLFYDPKTCNIIQKSLINSGFRVKVICLLPNIFLGACNGYMQRIRNHHYSKDFQFYLFKDMLKKNGFNYKKVLEFHRSLNDACVPKAAPYMHNCYGSKEAILHQFFSLADLNVPKALLNNEINKDFLGFPQVINSGICGEKIALLKFIRNILPDDQSKQNSKKILEFDTTGYDSIHAVNYLLSPINKKLIEEYISAEAIIIDRYLFQGCSKHLLLKFINLHHQEIYEHKPLDLNLLSAIFDSFSMN